MTLQRPIKSSAHELRPQTVMGHYKLVRKLGEGGMGMVYVAEDTRLGRTVALKVLHQNIAHDPDRRYRFLREGRLAAGLTHPCIATIYEVGEVDERLFIAMELIEGESIGELLAAQGCLPVPRALVITREVLRGLVKAHEAGVIHRDLKPENVICGADQVVKILDFGIAKRSDDGGEEATLHATKDGSIVGTPAYMSPEQGSGHAVDARTDIYSLGVMLYEMVTGKRPFHGDTWQEVIISVARDPLVSASTWCRDVSPELDVFLNRCLEKKPEGRFPTVRATLEDLERLVLGMAASSSRAGMTTGAALAPDLLGGATVAANTGDGLAQGSRLDADSGVAETGVGRPSPFLRMRGFMLLTVASAVVAVAVASYVAVSGSTGRAPSASGAGTSASHAAASARDIAAAELSPTSVTAGSASAIHAPTATASTEAARATPRDTPRALPSVAESKRREGRAGTPVLPPIASAVTAPPRDKKNGVLGF